MLRLNNNKPIRKLKETAHTKEVRNIIFIFAGYLVKGISKNRLLINT